MNDYAYELARLIQQLDDSTIRDVLVELKVNWPNTYYYIITELADEES